MNILIKDNFIEAPLAAAPASPAAGLSRIYPKLDGNWYWKDAAGVEHALIAQVQPFGFIDGTQVAPVFIVQTAGLSTVVRTPAGQPAGDYTITLSSAVAGALVAPPAASSGKWPSVTNVTGASNPLYIDVSVVGGTIPYTQVRVKIKNAALAYVDCFFGLTFVPF